MLLESEKRKQLHDVDEATVTPILKEVAKMHLQQTESAGQLINGCYITVFRVFIQNKLVAPLTPRSETCMYCNYLGFSSD